MLPHNFICKVCSKPFTSKKVFKGYRPKYCSQKCYGLSIAKWKVCLQCKTKFYNWQNDSFCNMECIANYKKGKPLSDKHKQALKLASKGKVPTHLHNKENYKKIGDALRGVPLPRIQNEKHGEWKGINASYFAKHAWLARKYGKANKCEYIHCKYPRKTSNNKILLAPKIYNWALIHGKEHDHKRENYMMLCCSCHSRYDHNTIEI